MSLSSPDPNAPARLLDALVQFEAVATLYAPFNARVIELCDGLRSALRSIAGSAGQARIENAGGHLRVQGIDVDANLPSAKRLHAELDALSILALEIDATADLDDLHAFARQWRVSAQNASRSQGLHVASLAGVPASIRVRFREFGRRIGDGSGIANDANPAPSAFEVAASSPGAPARSEHAAIETARAKRWVKRTLARVAERVESLDPRALPSASGPQGRSLDDVLALAGEVLQHAIDSYLSDAAQHGDLKKLFESIELATALSRDAESARLLVDVLQRSAEEAAGEEDLLAEQGLDEGARKPGEVYERSLDELRADLQACRMLGEPLLDVDREDRRECLSILLATLADAVDSRAAGTIAARLQALLAKPLDRAERELVSAAIRGLCGRLDTAAIDRLVPVLATALGGANWGLWIAALIEAARAGDAERLEVLWPHLANESLHGKRAQTSSLYAAVLEQVRRLPRARLPAAMRRLRRLDAMVDGKVERHAFRPLQDELAPFYAALLDSPLGAQVGAHLLAGLHERPTESAAAELLGKLGDCGAECQELLARLFAARDEHERREVALRAGRALAQRLAVVRVEHGSESWARSAIEALGKHAIGDAEPVLRRVARERRWLVFPRWPASCRAAARKALVCLAEGEHESEGVR